MLQKVMSGALAARPCLFCAAPAGAAGCCAACERDLPWNYGACMHCGLAIARGQRVCGRCMRTPAFDAACCAFHYRFPVDRAIVALKFGGRLGVARDLGQLLARAAAPAADYPDLLLPVPLHRVRLRERGFNQAAEIARTTGHRLHIRVATGRSYRRRDTAAQSALSASARRRNMRDAFAVRGRFSGQHIAIVDDVVTTGATTAALARALRQAGAAKISVWSVARAD